MWVHDHEVYVGEKNYLDNKYMFLCRPLLDKSTGRVLNYSMRGFELCSEYVAPRVGVIAGSWVRQSFRRA